MKTLHITFTYPDIGEAYFASLEEAMADVKQEQPEYDMNGYHTKPVVKYMGTVEVSDEEFEEFNND